MIYTVTLNPCLDYLVAVPNFQSGRVNRAGYERIMPGGKGINVSYVLNILNQENLALGLVGGFTGAEIERLMEKDGIRHDFVHLQNGSSRIDVQMLDGIESSIHGVGPLITQEDIDALCDQLQQLQDGDTLVLSGSVPRGARDTVYSDILRSVSHKDLYIVVDAKGPLLLNTLKYKPFLIKPNRQEMVDIFFLDAEKIDDIIHYAKNLQGMGARNVLVSLGSDGAVLVTESGEIYRHSAMRGKVHNTVGCGDSMLAGFLAGYHQNQDMGESFLLSLAAASANAFHNGRGTREEIMKLLDILHQEIEE
ncbi:MAG: 1-phosphofructokinase [Eubacteriales bacterium]|nr:1-phosphofructokinase [Eubacteriales bacterium]